MLWFVFCFVGLFHYAALESCHYQRCLACHPQEVEYYTGHPIQCDPSNWVTPEWVHNIGHPPPPPSTDSRVPVEYRCLTMIATPDDKSLGNTVDVIRGCVPRVQVDSVCLGLVAVERARGHSDAQCHVCKRYDCNSAATTTLPLSLVATLVLYHVLR